MQAIPKFQESHQHKDAGMESTVVIGAQPMEQPTVPDGFAPVDWSDSSKHRHRTDGAVHRYRRSDSQAWR